MAFPTQDEWDEIARRMEEAGLLIITTDPESGEEIWELTEEGRRLAPKFWGLNS